MVKNIIFDFGDVFINLDKAILTRELATIEDTDTLLRLKQLNEAFEIGGIGANRFIDGLKKVFPNKSRAALTDLWNAMLLDFPEYRLNFLENLAATREYRLFLLSNTNELHIPHVAGKMGKQNYSRFRSCFEGFYLSHELHLRKPEREIFEYVLNTNMLKAENTLFIDDTHENITTARDLGMHTWHLQVGMEDITALYTRL